MATINDIYSITLKGSCFGINISNHFTYKATATTCTASNMVIAFGNILLPKIVQVLSTSMIFSELVVNNLNDTTDFLVASILTGGVGLRSGGAAPTFVAFAWGSSTKDRSIRAGSKRFAVISESDTTDNQRNTTNATFNGYIGELSTALSSAFSVSGLGAIADPIVVKRNKTVVGGKTKYTLPHVATSSNHYVADNWQARMRLSHQDSRYEVI